MFDERRLEQENKGLLRKAKGRGVTVDQVVGVQSAETERELEELRSSNSSLKKENHSLREQLSTARNGTAHSPTSPLPGIKPILTFHDTVKTTLLH